MADDSLDIELNFGTHDDAAARAGQNLIDVAERLAAAEKLAADSVANTNRALAGRSYVQTSQPSNFGPLGTNQRIQQDIAREQSRRMQQHQERQYQAQLQAVRHDTGLSRAGMQDRVADRVKAEIESRQEQKMYQRAAGKAGLGPSFLESLPVVGGMVSHAKGIGEGATAAAKFTAATALAVGSIALLQQGFTTTAHIADTLGNNFKSSDQKFRAVAEGLPVIGGLIQSLRQLREAMDGTTDRIRRYSVAMEMQRSEIQVRGITEAPVMHLQQQAAAARGRADVMGSPFPWDKMPGYGGVDETPRLRGYAEQERAAAINVEKARREARAGLPGIAAAEANKAAYERATADKRRAGEALSEKNRRYRREHGIPEDLANTLYRAEEKPVMPAGARMEINWANRNSAEAKRQIAQDRIRAAYAPNEAADEKARKTDLHRYAADTKQESQNKDELLQRERQAEQMIVQIKEQKLDQEQKEIAVNKALVQADQTRLGILKSMEQHLRGQSSAFGGLHPGQQMMAVTWAKQAKERGFASLLPGQRALLQQAGGGEFVQRGLEKMGEANPLMAEFRKLIGEKGDLKTILPEINKLQTKVDVELNINEAKLTASIAAVMEHFFEVLTAKILKIGTTTAEKNERQIRTRNAEVGPS